MTSHTRLIVLPVFCCCCVGDARLRHLDPSLFATQNPFFASRIYVAPSCFTWRNPFFICKMRFLSTDLESCANTITNEIPCPSNQTKKCNAFLVCAKKGFTAAEYQWKPRDKNIYSRRRSRTMRQLFPTHRCKSRTDPSNCQGLSQKRSLVCWSCPDSRYICT